MPDGGLKATERQFLALLQAASQGVCVRVSLYGLPEIPRADWSRKHIELSYSAFEEIRTSSLDGLIVTGTEPRSANLADEPYWSSLTDIIDWAEKNTYSAIWSCLAAHAAVLHMDGVPRRKLAAKRFGVFECNQVSEHELTMGLPGNLMRPHSRWNDLSEDELTARGYSVLTRSDSAGVDTFIKQGRSLFIFLQGHPEYEANTLALEYARDVTRYLKRESDIYPHVPHAYFDSEIVQSLVGVSARALTNRCPDLIIDLEALLTRCPQRDPWHLPAVQLFRNWLTFLYAQKQRKLLSIEDLTHPSEALMNHYFREREAGPTFKAN